MRNFWRLSLRGQPHIHYLQTNKQTKSPWVSVKKKRKLTIWNILRAFSITMAYSLRKRTMKSLSNLGKGNHPFPVLASLPISPTGRKKKMLRNTCEGCSPRAQTPKNLRFNHKIIGYVSSHILYYHINRTSI